ncbi:unnamed protein product, partial [Symbiodinium necroappetens]
EERIALEEYSKDLFGTGEDFQLQGSSGSLGITSSDVMDQLRSIKLGKAVTQFGFVPGRGTEEAICKALTHVDEAFDMVDRRRLREALELAEADPFLIDLVGILTMYADDTLLQMHFDDKRQLQESLKLCDLLLDQLVELGRLIALKHQVPYLGIIISYQDYEMKSLRHRLQASKAALKEVAHAVRNSRAITEKRRLSIWRITAWASAMYGLHVVSLTSQGLAQLESHMIFQLRFVLRSCSQDTHENNQQFMQRKGLKTAKAQVLKRLQQFIKRQHKGDKEALLQHYLPRAAQAHLGAIPKNIILELAYFRKAEAEATVTELDQVHEQVKAEALRDPGQEAYRTSQLARITPEHQVLDSITRGWAFDGNQQDAAEFLSVILPNLSGIQVCCWETRSPLEAGYVVDEEGLSPIFLNVPIAEDLQTMINSWSNQTPARALVAAEKLVFLALPSRGTPEMAKIVAPLDFRRRFYYLPLKEWG